MSDLSKDTGWQEFSDSTVFDDICEEYTAKSAWRSAKQFYARNPHLLFDLAEPNPETIRRILELMGASTEPSQVELLNSAWPYIADERARSAEAQIDSLFETFIAIGNFLGIDAESSRNLPGKPSQVFIQAIEEYAKRYPDILAQREAEHVKRLETARALGSQAAKEFLAERKKHSRDTTSHGKFSWIRHFKSWLVGRTR